MARRVHIVGAAGDERPGRCRRPFAMAAGLLEDLAGVQLTGKRVERAAEASGAAQAAGGQITNAGSVTHELVVLPLPPAGAGTRPVGSCGTISERGSLGEASATCAAGASDGIAPGAAGWVTLHLALRRYELICDRPRHYAAGMFTELHVQ